MPSNSHKLPKLITFGVPIAVIVVIAANALWLDKLCLNSLQSAEGRGQFGDSFGLSNALFTALAFVILIITLHYQREELRLQRKELTLTREELKGQKEQLEIQNFENKFFGLLNLLREVVNSLSYKNRVGSDSFRVLSDKLFSHFDGNRKIISGIDKQKQIGKLYHFYVLERFPDSYFNYMRTLYHVFKFIDNAELETPKKKFYTNIVRAQVSFSELSLLFYNCLSPLGEDKFKPLVEKYALLKHLKPNSLFSETHKEMYAESAFK